MLASAFPTAALAGPPYANDDPGPTDPGKWQIDAFTTQDWSGGTRQAVYGVDVSYGLTRNVQINTTLPYLTVSEPGEPLRSDPGDLEVAVKYRFYHDEASGFAAAVYPRLILPTAGPGLGSGQVGAFLPVWLGAERGDWTWFGGAGYTINPGAGNRNYWSGGLAVTRAVTRRVTLGGEVFRQGADADDANGSTSIAAGATVGLGGPFSLLAAGGPIFADGGETGWHLYFALDLQF